MTAMSAAMERGMVLVMSIWDDNAANMLWLDSVYPPQASGPGAERGPCSTDSGKPDVIEKTNRDAFVSFMNVKFGQIGSTGGPPAPPTPPSPTPTPTPSPTPVPTPCCSWDRSIVGTQQSTVMGMRHSVKTVMALGVTIVCHHMAHL